MHTSHHRPHGWRSGSQPRIFAKRLQGVCTSNSDLGTQNWYFVPTWIIDSLEEDSAQIEEDGTRVIHVPRSILPPGAREGDVLNVGLEQQRRGKREAVRVTITLDPEATQQELDKSAKQVKRAKDASRRRDSGGDIEL